MTEDRRRRTFPKDYTPGSWAVRREFLRTSAPFPDPPFKEGEPVSEALARVVKGLGVPGADPAALRIAREWASIAPPDVAAHAEPGPFENGTLVLLVKSPVWLAELRGRQRALLTTLNSALSPDGPPPVRALRLLAARG